MCTQHRPSVSYSTLRQAALSQSRRELDRGFDAAATPHHDLRKPKIYHSRLTSAEKRERQSVSFLVGSPIRIYEGFLEMRCCDWPMFFVTARALVPRLCFSMCKLLNRRPRGVYVYIDR